MAREPGPSQHGRQRGGKDDHSGPAEEPTAESGSCWPKPVHPGITPRSARPSDGPVTAESQPPLAGGLGQAFTVAAGLAHRIQPVAGAADGHDLEAELAEAAELFPQPADVDVHGLAVAQV